MRFLKYKSIKSSSIFPGTIFAFVLACHAPVQALYLNPSTSLTNQCGVGNSKTLDCSVVASNTEFTVYGQEGQYEFPTTSGFAAGQGSSYTVSFNYSFDGEVNLEQKAYYLVDGVERSLSGSGSIGLFTVSNSQSLVFGVNTGQSHQPPQLKITNFQTEGVPAPLPLLGGASAFVWIRRRRSQLKARQQSSHI